MPLVASISGVRGTIPDSLTDAVLVRYTRSFLQLFEIKRLVIGRDGRPSGVAICRVVGEECARLGVDVVDVGVVPTPTVQMEVVHWKADGGVAISASHNPAEWNGLKFLGSDGLFLLPDQVEALNADAAHQAPPVEATARGTHRAITDAVARHVDAVLGLTAVDAAGIRARGFRVAVDAVNAAGSEAIPALLRALGCTVVPVACDGTGLFPHPPEPLPEHLIALCAAVREHGADLGIAVDPDADRLVLISEDGVPFGEEYTIVACVDAVLSVGGAAAPVVINESTTRAVEDVAARHGVAVVRTPVGEIHVAAGMRTHHAVIGGEGSGGVLYAPLHLGRDSLAGTALVLTHLAHTRRSASALRASFPSYVMVKRKHTVATREAATAMLARARALPGIANVRTDDGVRYERGTGWVHLRQSNTEPIVRVIAEAPTAAEAARLADEVEAAALRATD